MSLFLVNRYLGEEENGSVSKESRSQALLAKLQQKAKENQKQSLTEKRQHPPKERTKQEEVKIKIKSDDDSSQEPQRHKKRKSEAVPLLVAESDNHDEQVEEKQNKTGANEKRKKKKDQSVCLHLRCRCRSCCFLPHLHRTLEKLQQLGLHQPRLFSSIHSHSSTISSSTTAASPTQKQGCFNFPQGLTEYYVPCTLSKKPLLLFHFILRMKFSPILCFTNSRETAHGLYLLVQLFGGIQAAEFSSRLSPAERKKTLKKFEQGKLELLISTDAAARGIDINGVKCVVNYDAPQYIRVYIHRIGRTARAGKTGLAFTFLLGVQEKNFLQMVVEAAFHIPNNISDGRRGPAGLQDSNQQPSIKEGRTASCVT
ncbi:ATP-dependent RNA helicase DDX51-like [Cottoperca gobio]|uniref:ATP-dependent RNA helicase n=1 Tax=Cottoperca gobio TaxID=56716 RepID=A0A6J2P8D3_COTGO|nr:ATP-dependent RNA helicase DDX51-like [Cottoperca gobio]